MSDASWNGKVAELKGIGTAVQSGPTTSVASDAFWNGKVAEVKVNGRVFEHIELRQKTPEMEERSKVLGDFAIALGNGAFEIITNEIIGISWRTRLLQKLKTNRVQDGSGHGT